MEPQILEMVCAEILEGRGSVPMAWDDIAGQAQAASAWCRSWSCGPCSTPHLFKAERATLACNVVHQLAPE